MEETKKDWLKSAIEELKSKDMQVIGLAGKARTGKTTVGKTLAQEGFYPTAFADPLKRGLEGMLGISLLELDDDTYKTQVAPEFGITYRKLMQLVGTEVFRAVDPNFWIKLQAKHLLNAAGKGISKVVITDLRFSNEAEFIRALNGTVVHISRNGAEGAGGVEGHGSEAGLPVGLEDVTIKNEGSLQDLKDAAIRLAGCLEVKKTDRLDALATFVEEAMRQEDA